MVLCRDFLVSFSAYNFLDDNFATGVVKNLRREYFLSGRILAKCQTL
uniref:Uncharacterized protein n=1 Tax=Arundo donax TaxID=35708 RepID=A0A0A9HFC2_ARUDO